MTRMLVSYNVIAKLKPIDYVITSLGRDVSKKCMSLNVPKYHNKGVHGLYAGTRIDLSVKEKLQRLG